MSENISQNNPENDYKSATDLSVTAKIKKEKKAKKMTLVKLTLEIESNIFDQISKIVSTKMLQGDTRINANEIINEALKKGLGL